MQTTFEGIPDNAQKNASAEAPAQIRATERQAPAARLADEFRGLSALSIRQPWAWLILNAGKDIENRTWQTHFRGRFLIHASKGCTRKEYREAIEDWVYLFDIPDERVPSFESLNFGGIVGVATIADCVAKSESEWFSGPFGFVLRDVQPLQFVPCTGALGFFKPQP